QLGHAACARSRIATDEHFVWCGWRHDETHEQWCRRLHLRPGSPDGPARVLAAARCRLPPLEKAQKTRNLKQPHIDCEPKTRPVVARREGGSSSFARRGRTGRSSPDRETLLCFGVLCARFCRSWPVSERNMVDLRRYEKLHTIQMLKEVIRKWWGVELAFA